MRTRSERENTRHTAGCLSFVGPNRAACAERHEDTLPPGPLGRSPVGGTGRPEFEFTNARQTEPRQILARALFAWYGGLLCRLIAVVVSILPLWFVVRRISDSQGVLSVV